jgi:glutamate-1-semialdehyde 2,1-aminomutase
MKTSRSEALFARAQTVIPGGVNSPVRAFRGVGGTPLFIQSGTGSRILDADDNSYIDYVGSWGPLLLGHRPPPVIEALRQVLETGTSFGAPTEREIELAELISTIVPSMEMVRLVNSGTEATMSASLLVKAGSGMATLGIADSAGVPAGFAETTMALPFNSIPAIEAAFAARGPEIAAVIVEPVVGNMGCVPPVAGFLEALRRLTERHGAVLIFDEVMTGFRVALGGAQQRYGIKPDLTTLGKIIGGGLPIGAYGGRADIMQKVSPLGPVYQAGTLSGNPLAVAAGLAMLRHLSGHPEIYDQLEARAKQLCEWIPPGVTINRVGSMFTFFFSPDPVTDWESAKKSDTARFAKFFHFLLERGVYIAPSQFEAGFVSAAHTEDDIRATTDAAREFFT